MKLQKPTNPFQFSDTDNISRLLNRDIGPAVRVFANGPSHTKDFKNGT